MPCAFSSASSCAAQLLDVLPRARRASRPASRHLLVGVGLEEAEGQVLHLPLHLPDAQPVGQRREHVQRLARHAGRTGRLVAACQRSVCSREARRSITTRRSREKASSILRTFSVCTAGRPPGAPSLGAARLLLHAHQLGGLHRQRGIALAEGLGDHLLRLVQVRRRHRPGSWPPAWPRSRPWTSGWRRRRRRGPACSRRCPASRRRSAARRRRGRAPARWPAAAAPVRRRPPARGRGGLTLFRGMAFHRGGSGRSRKEATASTWSSAIRVGAWPTPANSTSCGLRAALRHLLRGGARQQVGLRAAQQQRAARIASYSCQSAAWPAWPRLSSACGRARRWPGRSAA
jgi:hypothetical protein